SQKIRIKTIRLLRDYYYDRTYVGSDFGFYHSSRRLHGCYTSDYCRYGYQYRCNYRKSDGIEFWKFTYIDDRPFTCQSVTGFGFGRYAQYCNFRHYYRDFISYYSAGYGSAAFKSVVFCSRNYDGHYSLGNEISSCGGFWANVSSYFKSRYRNHYGTFDVYADRYFWAFNRCSGLYFHLIVYCKNQYQRLLCEC